MLHADSAILNFENASDCLSFYDVNKKINIKEESLPI